jgi:hypothetical protein
VLSKVEISATASGSMTAVVAKIPRAVWADLFDLKGEHPFWSTIQEALRHHACKMIFVVSS